MASLAPQPHPPTRIHSAHHHAHGYSSPSSCPQPPPQPSPSPRPLQTLSISPSSSSSSSPTLTTPATASSSSAQAKSTVRKSMLDIDVDIPAQQTKASKKSLKASASSTTSVPTKVSRHNSTNGRAGEKEIPDLSLSHITTTPANLPSHITAGGSDPADKALPRATTSPNLLNMAVAPSGAPLLLRPHLQLATRGKSELNFTRRLLPEHTPSSPSSSSTPPRRPSAGPLTPQRESTLRKLGSFLKRSRQNSYSGQDPAVQVAAPTTTSSVATQKSKSTGPSASSSHSPITSPSATPPSPSSRENTIMEYDEIAPDQAVPPPDPATLGHTHSASVTDMAERSPTPRMGITWGPNFTDDGFTMDQPARQRRRSISQDNLRRGFRQKDRDPDAPAELMATFSFRSMEGVGLKARRLSTLLPDDFHIEHDDLNKDFVPATHIPFSRGRMVGKGATAVVRLFQRRNDPARSLFAVKEYRGRDKSEPEDEYVKKVKSEYSIAHSLNHPNIVRSVALCTNHGKWNNVMEYCQFGEMYHWVEKGTFKKEFKLDDRNCFFKQLIRGVDYLHSHGIAHRDIKLENLLLTAEGHLKITDFGVSDVFSGQHPGLLTSHGKCGQNMGSIRRCSPGICGSLPYIAPEVLDKKGDYDPRALDVWSCAIVYLTMTYGGGPWGEATSRDQLYSRFLTGWDNWYETHPDGEITDAPKGSPILPGMFSSKSPMGLTSITSPAMRRCILKMLNPYPEKRADIHSILTTNVIKNIDCCTSESCDEDGKPIERVPTADCSLKTFKKIVVKKHNHIPPKEHKTPLFFQHRFDMGDGYR